MKKLLILLLLLCPFLSHSQGTASYSVRLKNNQGAAMPGTPITLIETETKERISKPTDASGTVKFELNSGKKWKIHILQISNAGVLKVPESGSSRGDLSLTYDYNDWQRKHRPVLDRKQLGLETVVQKNISTKPSATDALVEIHFQKANKKPLTNFPVTLVCYKLKKSYQSTTNSAGIAAFLVPADNDYEIDIDGVESFNYIDIGKYPGKYGLELTYEPTDIKETNKSDTITQKFAARTEGTSGRTYTRLTVNCTDCSDITQESVYLREIGSSRVYTAKLNKKGEAEFLLPIRKQYMISFDFDFDVDVIDLSDVKGISAHEQMLTYRPRPELKYPGKYLVSPESLIEYDLSSLIKKESPSQQSPVIIRCAWGNPSVNAQSKEALLAVSFQCNATPNQKIKSPPSNICFVLDKSGSMAGDRMDELKKALLRNAAIIRPDDIVSMVSFDEDSRLLVPAQKFADKAYFTDMVNDLSASGGTNIYEGLVNGYKEATKNYKPNQVNRVVLLTDGYDGYPVDSTLNMSKKYNKKGIGISAIGVGDDYNYALLNLLALNGGGQLSLTPESKGLEDVIKKELSTIISPIGSKGTLEVTFDKNMSLKQVFGWPNTSTMGTKFTARIDNLYDGQNNLALLKLDLLKVSPDIENNPVTIKFKYFDISQQKEIVITEKAFLKWTEETGKMDFIFDAYIKKLYTIAYINQSLKGMMDDYTKSNFKGLEANLNSLIKNVKEYYAQPTEEEILRMMTSLEKYSKNVSLAAKAR